MSQQMTALAEAYGTIAEAQYQDRVTFTRSTVTKGSAGGNLVSAPATTTASVPCRYKPVRGNESQLAGKTISGVAYFIYVPASYSDELVDVDARCQAVLAARTGGEVSRTFNVVAPLRFLGIEIECLVSLES